MMSGDDLTKQSGSGWESRILAEMPVAFFVTDGVGKVTIWSSKMEELTGRSAKDILGKRSWAGFFDKKRSTPVDLAIASEEEESDEAFPVQTAEGKKELLFNARPLLSEEGRVQGVIAILQAPAGGGSGPVEQFLAAAKKVDAEQDGGLIDAELEASAFEGPLAELATVVNRMQKKYMESAVDAMGLLGSFVAGDFSEDISRVIPKSSPLYQIVVDFRDNLEQRLEESQSAQQRALKISDFVTSQAARMAQAVLNISRGDLHSSVEIPDGDEDTHDVRESLISLRDAIRQLKNGILRLSTDTESLVAAGLEGRLDARIDASAHQGKFAAIVDGLNSMLDSFLAPIKESAAVLRSLAAGDLTARVSSRYQGEYEEFTHDLNQVAVTFSRSIGEFAQSATMLAGASEELSSISQTMASNAEESAAQASVVSSATEQVTANISTVAAGAEEMGASIRDIARNAHEAAKVSQAAVSTTQKTNAIISKLGESSAEIGKVIKVITSIAGQTNLLALNATIEAARAGEAGRGFAVVANEVKELAKETARATEDISNKIEAIQGDTQAAVGAIAEIGSVIASVNDIANSIAGAVEEQTATTNEITSNMSGVALAISEISTNISGLAEASRSTSSGSTDTQRAAQELARMANELQKLVSVYRYEG